MPVLELEDSHVFYPGSDPVEDASVLKAHLDNRVAVNLAYLQRRKGKVPKLYDSGVVYGRTTKWHSIPGILKLGYADCKSLAPWRIAEMIYYGVCKDPIPVFRYDYRPNGGGLKDFHVLIDTPQGHECPSRQLGMGQPGPHNRSNRFAMSVSGDSNRLFMSNPIRHMTKGIYPFVYW